MTSGTSPAASSLVTFSLSESWGTVSSLMIHSGWAASSASTAGWKVASSCGVRLTWSRKRDRTGRGPGTAGGDQPDEREGCEAEPIDEAGGRQSRA